MRSCSNYNRKIAFTLAEVLITLGIIGVVAAMTMPSLIANYQKQKTVNQLKKAYTTLAQAVKLSELENDVVENWDYTLLPEEFFNSYLSQFLTVSTSNVTNSNLEYKYLNGTTCSEDLCTQTSYIAHLADGSSLIISRHQWLSSGRVVSIDINGDKRPNVIGKDFFSFAVTKENGLVPFGYGGFGTTIGDDINQAFGNYDRQKLTGNDGYACNKTKRGFWCAALIITDGWEMRKDYPG